MHSRLQANRVTYLGKRRALLRLIESPCQGSRGNIEKRATLSKDNGPLMKERGQLEGHVSARA